MIATDHHTASIIHRAPSSRNRATEKLDLVEKRKVELLEFLNERVTRVNDSLRWADLSSSLYLSNLVVKLFFTLTYMYSSRGWGFL